MITSKGAFGGDERRGKSDFPQFPGGERRFLAFLPVLTTAAKAEALFLTRFFEKLEKRRVKDRIKRPNVFGRRRREKGAKGKRQTLFLSGVLKSLKIGPVKTVGKASG